MNLHDALLATLAIEPLDRDLFRGNAPPAPGNRIFGGLVIAQALRAAIATVEGRAVHSLHAYFLLAGDAARPILYEVDRIRDGRSFTTRRVVARQNGEALFALSASFHVEEDGHRHAFAMPDVPAPETLPGQPEIMARYLDILSPMRRAFWQKERPIELRPTDPERYFRREPGPPLQHVWFRVKNALPDDPDLHRVLLAYVSDMTLLDGAMMPHGKSVVDPDVQSWSLDHALWFHEPFRADEWLLYAQDSPWSGHARGIGRGLVFARDGRLVASVIQEGLIRPRRADLPRK